jgi:hypothetical protein
MSESNRAPMGQELPPRPAVQLNGIGFYSAKQIGELTAPYAERIRHLEREQMPKLDEDDEVSFPGDAKLAVLHEAKYWKLRAAEERVAVLERELAERKRGAWIGSIDDYSQFHLLLSRWMELRDYYQDDQADPVKVAWGALIAYIDGRSAGTVPEGWKPVPVEPTDDMIVAFAEQWYSKVRCIDDCQMEDCYAAMIAAAPTPTNSGRE